MSAAQLGTRATLHSAAPSGVTVIRIGRRELSPGRADALRLRPRDPADSHHRRFVEQVTGVELPGHSVIVGLR